jgi:hypothetical protein
MKAQELRITNLIHFVKENKDAEIGHHNLGIFLAYPSSNEYEPIPITKDWLLNFGFKRDKKRNDFFDRALYFNEEVATFRVMLVDNGFWFIVEKPLGDGTRKGFNLGTYKYVHQLQNLYFALTGEELTIK